MWHDNTILEITRRDNVMHVFPNHDRVLRDVESVRQEATLLREQMQIVKEDIKRVSWIL